MVGYGLSFESSAHSSRHIRSHHRRSVSQSRRIRRIPLLQGIPRFMRSLLMDDEQVAKDIEKQKVWDAERKRANRRGSALT